MVFMNSFYKMAPLVRVLSGSLTGISMVSGPILGIVSYVLTAIALYTLAERRGIRHGWLAWIPIANVWVLGSLSDQYRYVVRGEVCAKRKALLTLRIVSTVLGGVLTCITAVVVVGVVGAFTGALSRHGFTSWVTGPATWVLGVGVVMLGISIAYLVLRFMALYDVFCSCDPQNAVLYLVLSIFVGITCPFFLFACRNKDYGMPARRVQPQWQNPEEN